MSTDERLARVALGCLVEPGNRELGHLVRRVGPPAALDLLCRGGVSDRLAGVAAVRLGGSPSREAAREIACRMVEAADRLGAYILMPEDDQWPSQLTDLVRISRDNGLPVDRDTYPPLCLWMRGG